MWMRALAFTTLLGLASGSAGLAQGLPSDVEQRLGLGPNRGFLGPRTARGSTGPAIAFRRRTGIEATRL